MFAAQDDRKLVAIHELRGHPADFGHDLVHARKRKLHFWQRADADAVDVGL
jgi:hypothetical protein